MDTNSISSFFVDHTWARNDGVNTDPSWHRVTERTDTPPLLKEVHLTGSHIDLTFTSIKESPEECGTSLNISSKQALRFVDEANSDVSHPCFDHRSYNVYTSGTCQYLVSQGHRSHTHHQSGVIRMFLSHSKPRKHSILREGSADNLRYHDWQ